MGSDVTRVADHNGRATDVVVHVDRAINTGIERDGADRGRAVDQAAHGDHRIRRVDRRRRDRTQGPALEGIQRDDFRASEREAREREGTVRTRRSRGRDRVAGDDRTGAIGRLSHAARRQADCAHRRGVLDRNRAQNQTRTIRHRDGARGSRQLVGDRDVPEVIRDTQISGIQRASATNRDVTKGTTVHRDQAGVRSIRRRLEVDVARDGDRADVAGEGITRGRARVGQSPESAVTVSILTTGQIALDGDVADAEDAGDPRADVAVNRDVADGLFTRGVAAAGVRVRRNGRGQVTAVRARADADGDVADALRRDRAGDVATRGRDVADARSRERAAQALRERHILDAVGDRNRSRDRATERHVAAELAGGQGEVRSQVTSDGNAAGEGATLEGGINLRLGHTREIERRGRIQRHDAARWGVGERSRGRVRDVRGDDLRAHGGARSVRPVLGVDGVDRH